MTTTRRTVRVSASYTARRRAERKAAERRTAFGLAVLFVCGVVLFFGFAMAGTAPGLDTETRDLFAFGSLLGFMASAVSAFAATQYKGER